MDESAVLVVEDDDNFRELVTMALQALRGSWRIHAYPTGPAALAAMAALAVHQRPWLAVLDFHMPGLSGLEVLRRLRAMGFAGRCVVLSNAASPPERAACEAEGASFLPKPSLYGDLLGAMAALVAPPRSRDRTTS